jgi:hypothetical protein
MDQSKSDKQFNINCINFLIIIASIVLTLIACEAALRFVNYPLPPKYGWGPDWAPSASVPPPAGFSSSNGAPQRSKVRILLLGDSQVGSRSSPQDPLPGKLLEIALNSHATILSDSTACGTLPALRKRQILSEALFEVDTLGASGWGQDQEFLHLQQFINHQRYDLVLLWFTPENDIWNNAFPTHWPLNGAAKPTFLLAKNGQLQLAPKLDITSRLLDSNYKTYALFLHAINRLSRLVAEHFGLQSQVYTGMLLSADQYWYNHFIANYKPDDHPQVENSTSIHHDLISREFSPAEFEIINPNSLGDSTKYEKSHFAIAANPSSAGIRYMVDLTHALVAQIGALTLSSGSEFGAFWYDASKTQQPLYPEDGIYKVNYGNLHNLQISSSVMRQRLAKIFAGMNHASILLETPEWREPNNDPHLTTDANRILMSSIARCLLRAD